MIKGGYKIVNFNGAALSGTAVTLAGIYDQIVDDYDKPVMVSGVSINGDIMDDAYAGVQEKVAGDLSKSVELTVYGGIITVTEDDEVSFVISKTTAELTAELGNLEDLNTTDKDSAVDAINEVVANKANSLVVETKSDSISITSGSDFSKSIDAQKTGYTIVGVVGYTLAPRSKNNITSVQVTGNNISCSGSGNATGDYTFSADVLYVKS